MGTDDASAAFNIWKSVLRGSGFVSLSMIGVYPLFAWYGYYRFGSAGLTAAAVAGAVCWFGGILGLAVASQFTGRQAANGALLATLIRMVPPLLFGIAVLSQQSSLLKAGVLEMAICYYLFGLAIETTWLVRHLRRQQESIKAQ